MNKRTTFVLDYPALLENIEKTDLALDVLTMIQSTLPTQIKQLESSEDAPLLQNTLHQLKGLLPMLCHAELTELLVAEEAYLRKHLTPSSHYPKLLNTLKTLLGEIDVFLNHHSSEPSQSR